VPERRLKFIHTADIHLDSPLSGLAAYKDAPSDRLRTVTRDAFTRLVDVAIEEAVDFMVIAGDLYDGSWKDYNTGHFFCREMGRLHQAGIAVYLLLGNHDADSEMTKKLTLPPNVHQFDSRKAHTFRIEALKVALHGRSYKEAATVENLAASYPSPVAGWLNIGVLHTALEGYAAHASYAPCSLAELSAKGYDYWALGHVHEHAILQQDPWVVFPGNLQGRHIRETGARGAMLVSADDGAIQSVERLLVDVLRWQLVTVDASAAQTLPEVVRRVGQAFERLLADTPAQMYLSVRVCISGKTAAHGELFGLESQLREEILGQAAGQGVDRLWLEKVRLETSPLSDASQLLARSDAVADLQRFLDEAPTDAALLASLLADLRPLLDRLPMEVIQSVPDLNALRSGDVAGLVKAVTPGLLAYLASASEGGHAH
jgi:exonuclease SbcD